MDDQSEVRREIVDAARTHFVRCGYSRVSTDDIVKSINRSKKTLYKHFETKEALLQAVLAQINTEIEEQLAALCAGGGHSDGDLRCLHAVLSRVAAHVAATDGVLFTDLKARSQALYLQSHAQRRRGLVGVLAGYLRRGIAAGYLRDDLDVEQVLAVFLASVESLAAPLVVDEEDDRRPDERSAILVTLVIDGLRRR